MRSAGRVVLILGVCTSCALFGGGETRTLTGSFVAYAASMAGDSAGTCSVSVDGGAAQGAKATASWRLTSSFMGRDDLPALEMMCSLGPAYEDGYLMVTIPNLSPDAQLENQPISFIELAHGSWSSHSNPGVAWLIGNLPPLTSGYLSSRSGQLTITRADSIAVAGSFTVSAHHEWHL